MELNKLSLETTTHKRFLSHTVIRKTLEKLDDLEKCCINATSN